VIEVANDPAPSAVTVPTLTLVEGPWRSNVTGGVVAAVTSGRGKLCGVHVSTSQSVTPKRYVVLGVSVVTVNVFFPSKG
jgi:hypothetical protein